MDAALSVYVAIGRLVAEGAEAAKIQGQMLYDKIRNSPFEGVSGFVNLTKGGERSLKYDVNQIMPIFNKLYNSNSTAVKVGVYDSTDNSFVITGTLRFADGTETPPRDRRPPCLPGTE